MTFSPNDLPFGDSKSATGFEPFMAAAFAPAMMTGAMMMQGYAFWMSAARSFAPTGDDAALPIVELPKPGDITAIEKALSTDLPALATAMLDMPQGIDVPETTVASEPAGQRPIGFAKARDGIGDDLTLISGIGPKIEKKLHDLGVFHWNQIAEWTADEVTWVDSFLDFKGRIARESWQSQAAALALGGIDEYVKRFGKEPH